jgi:hypothetical protein
VVALERVLVRTDKVAICLTRLAAYPTGFEFDIVTMSADDCRIRRPQQDRRRRSALAKWR